MGTIQRLSRVTWFRSIRDTATLGRNPQFIAILGNVEQVYPAAQIGSATYEFQMWNS
jgi:hypothetical protein